MSQQRKTRSGTRSKKPGRPKGSRNRDYETSISLPSSCFKCGSTERIVYGNKNEVVSSGTRPDGTRYNRVVHRRVRCEKCGQHRIEKSYELRDES